MSTTILVTGGCGFLGSHLIDKLLKNPNNMVICVDNCCSSSQTNIDHLKKNKNFMFIHMDVIKPTDILAQFKIDEIYHLACPASPPAYQRDPIKTLKTGFIGTLNMLELAKTNDAKFLLTSTSEVYGDPEVHPQVEEYWGNVNPIGIRACYDESKRISETLAFEFYRQHNVQIRVARIFNTYGPRMLPNDGRVVSNFITQALQGKKLTIYGDGSQTRSFCYVSDTIDGLVALMHSDQTGPINIGNPDEYTILQLARIIISNIKAVDISFKDLPKDDPTKRKPDITKAKTYLKWEPTVQLGVGLTRTIKYFSSL